GVDAVVVTPVSHRTAGDAHLERLAVRQRVARHEAAITPAPHAYARTVDVRLALQPRQTIFKIAQLELAEVLVHGPGRIHSLTARGAIVADPNDVALLR